MFPAKQRRSRLCEKFPLEDGHLLHQTPESKETSNEHDLDHQPATSTASASTASTPTAALFNFGGAQGRRCVGSKPQLLRFDGSHESRRATGVPGLGGGAPASTARPGVAVGISRLRPTPDVNTNGGAFNLGGAQGPRSGDGHGGVQSAVFDSNFDGIDLSHVNTNGGAFNLGGAQGVGGEGHGLVQSGIEASNFDGISLADVNTNGGAFNFGGAQGARRSRRRPGLVQSGIENSNFNNIHLSDVNTNGGGFNFGGAQGLGGHGGAESHIDNSNFSNISFDHLNLNHGDFNFGGAQAAHFEVPHH